MFTVDLGHGLMPDTPVILVLGMHRSGTSAVAGWLHHAGLSLPDEVLPPHPVDNPHGYFEPRSLVQLNNHLLKILQLDWRSDGPLTAAAIHTASNAEQVEAIDAWLRKARALDRPLVLKDPRLCRLLPLWLPALARNAFSVQALLVVRSGHAVADSLARRANHEGIYPAAITDAAQSTLLWLRYNLEARRALDEAGLPTYTLAYEDFTCQPDRREHVLRWAEAGSGLSLDRRGARQFPIGAGRVSASGETSALPADWKRLLDQAHQQFLASLPRSPDEAALLEVLEEPIPASSQPAYVLPVRIIRGLRMLQSAAGWNPATARSVRPGSNPEWLFVSEALKTRSHIYRVKQPLDALHRLGLRADWVAADAEPPANLDGTRVLVIHRSRWTPRLAEWIALARRAGARVVADFDDLVFDPALIEDERIAFISALDKNARSRWQADFSAWRDTLAAADAALVTTPALAEQAAVAGVQAFVKPNGLAPELCAAAAAWHRQDTHAKDGTLRIGYASGTATHERDFARVAAVLVDALQRHRDWKLVLIGSIRAEGLLEGLPVDRIERRPRVAWANLPGELARLDLALAPLEPTVFNACKSPLKWLDAALLGVTTLASEHGGFGHWLRHGIDGWLAGDTPSWRRGLQTLMSDAALRRELGQAARKRVLADFDEGRLIAQLLADFD